MRTSINLFLHKCSKNLAKFIWINSRINKNNNKFRNLKFNQRFSTILGIFIKEIMQNLSKNFRHFNLTYSRPPSPAPWEPWRPAVFQPPRANNSLTKTREGTLGLKSLKKLQPQSIDTIWLIEQQVEKVPSCSIFKLFDLIRSSFQRKRSILIVSVKNNQWQLFTITASWGSDNHFGQPRAWPKF